MTENMPKWLHNFQQDLKHRVSGYYSPLSLLIAIPEKNFDMYTLVHELTHYSQNLMTGYGMLKFRACHRIYVFAFKGISKLLREGKLREQNVRPPLVNVVINAVYPNRLSLFAEEADIFEKYLHYYAQIKNQTVRELENVYPEGPYSFVQYKDKISFSARGKALFEIKAEHLAEAHATSMGALARLFYKQIPKRDESISDIELKVNQVKDWDTLNISGRHPLTYTWAYEYLKQENPGLDTLRLHILCAVALHVGLFPYPYKGTGAGVPFAYYNITIAIGLLRGIGQALTNREDSPMTYCLANLLNSKMFSVGNVFEDLLAHVTDMPWSEIYAEYKLDVDTYAKEFEMALSGLGTIFRRSATFFDWLMTSASPSEYLLYPFIMMRRGLGPVIYGSPSVIAEQGSEDIAPIFNSFTYFNKFLHEGNLSCKIKIGEYDYYAPGCPYRKTCNLIGQAGDGASLSEAKNMCKYDYYRENFLEEAI